MKDDLITALIQHAHDNSPAFQKRLDAAGIKPDEVRSIDDLARIPVFTKDEAIALQAADPPFGGMLAAPASAVSHLFFSPGPLYEPGPEPDDAAWDTAVKMLREVGFSAGEIILNSLSYHLVPAGYLFDGAFTRLGATVIPGGSSNRLRSSASRSSCAVRIPGARSWRPRPRGCLRCHLGCPGTSRTITTCWRTVW